MKVRKQQNYSGAGKMYNEDRCAFNGDSAWVIDGASGLAGNVITQTSDAAWYSNWWNEYLVKNANDFSRTLKEVLKDGLKLITLEYAKLTEGKELSKLQKPSAGIAIVRKKGKDLEYFTLGDCMISVKSGSKTKEFILPELGVLDESVTVYMAKLYKEGKYDSVLDTMKDQGVKDRLAENRLKLNTPSGYWVMSFQQEAIDNAFSGIIKNDNVDVLLMSDGFYSLIDKYEKVDFKGLFEMVKQRGVEGTYDEIRRIEDEDADCNTYPRFKKGDDTTAVYMDLEKE